MEASNQCKEEKKYANSSAQTDDMIKVEWFFERDSPKCRLLSKYEFETRVIQEYLSIYDGVAAGAGPKTDLSDFNNWKNLGEFRAKWTYCYFFEIEKEDGMQRQFMTASEFAPYPYKAEISIYQPLDKDVRIQTNDSYYGGKIIDCRLQ